MIRIKGRLHHTKETLEKLRGPKPWMKNNLFNVGKPHSEETKQKIRDAAIKRWSNKSERQRQSLAMQGDYNPMSGRHHTEESKMKMSLAGKGKTGQWNKGRIPWNKGLTYSKTRTKQKHDKVQDSKRS